VDESGIGMIMLIVALFGFITMERVGLGLRKWCLRNSSLLGVKKDDGPIVPLVIK
jgi:hypothetical protein